MLPITFAALCVAVISAESSSLSSYSSNPSNTQYEYSSGSYLNGKPSYSDLGSGTYISAGSSPYAKSDSRYTSDTNGDSDPRASLASSFYKTKYGSETVVNSLRPSTYHHSASAASSSAPESSSNSAELSSSSQQQPSSQYSSSEYTSSSGHPSSSSSAAYYASQTGHGGASGSVGVAPSLSNEYSTTGSFSYERQPSEQQQQQQQQQQHQTVYASAAEAVANAQAADYVPTRSAYTGYSGSPGLTEYAQTRPSAYSHSGLGSPISSFSSSDYPVSSGSSVPHHHHHHPHQHRPHQHSYSFNDEYPSAHAISQSQSQPHAYKTYIMSSGTGGPSSYPSKYQSVFGAIKSLFTGGSFMPDASPSATHVSSYPSSASSGSSSAYYSPTGGVMSHGSGHHGPSAPAAMSSGGPGYYFSSGPGGSSSPYAKQSYGMPMRFTSSYGGTAVGGGSPGSKIIVIRDNGSGHTSAYPSSGAGLIASPSSSYAAAKSKISAFAPGAGPSYLSASPPSSLGYSGGPISSGYPSGGYSSGGFGGGHGGSTFLGYSA